MKKGGPKTALSSHLALTRYFMPPQITGEPQ